MKAVAVLLLFLAAGTTPAVSPEIPYFRYQRPVEHLPATAMQTCVALDSGIFAHAAPRLTDLRLYRGEAEVPYAIQTAAPVNGNDQQVALLNLGTRGGQTVFDASMPAGSYGDVQLSIDGHDFLATVTVTGSLAGKGAPETKLGSYTIFDLSQQKLGRSTVLHLPVSNFPVLHFLIAGPIQPGNVSGLAALRINSTAPRYMPVAATSLVAQQGHETVVHLAVPAHTPVDHIYFQAGTQPANFSRDVRIRVALATPPKNNSAEMSPPVETTGNLLRVHRVEDGHSINEERLRLDAPQGMTDEATHWTITIENGDDAPIDLRSVALEMVERDLCFDAAAGATYTLYYGDEALSAPRYDYASLFRRQKDTAQATTGPESANPVYQSRPDARPFTEQHPILLWVALGLVILLLGGITLRTAKSSAANGHS